jgi:hypothetical protein
MGQVLKRYVDENFARLDEKFAVMETLFTERIKQAEKQLLMIFHK